MIKPIIIIKKIVFLIVIALYLNSCRPSKELNYSYTIPWYNIDSAKHLISLSSFISYGDYLFEFNVRQNTITTIYAAPSPSNSIVSSANGKIDSTISSTHYDTLSAYLLKNKSNLYFEFDTFALKNSLLKTDNIEKKEAGFKFPNFVKMYSTLNTPVFRGKVKDTLIEKAQYYYTDSVYKKPSSVDSFGIITFFIKNANINTIYSFNRNISSENEFAVAGFSFYSFEKKDRSSILIKDIRPLTRSEKKICAAMIKKAQAAVTDTI